MNDEKASPGPWRWIKVDDDSRVLRHSGSDDPYYSAVFHPDIDGMGIHISDADAALIADAWQLPQLRDLLDELAGIAEQAARMLNVVGITEADGPVGRPRALLDRKKRTP